jgi:hypothetical protein
VAEEGAAAVVGRVDDPALVVAVHHPAAEPGHVAQALDRQHGVVEVELSVGVPDDARRRVLLARGRGPGEDLVLRGRRGGVLLGDGVVDRHSRRDQQQWYDDRPGPGDSPTPTNPLVVADVLERGRRQHEQLLGGLLPGSLGSPGPPVDRHR